MKSNHYFAIVIGLVAATSLRAMEENNPKQRMLLREDLVNGVQVTVERQILDSTLETLQKIGQEQPYALVYLKTVSGGMDGLCWHLKVLQKNQATYKSILKQYGIMKQNDSVDETIQGIALQSIVILRSSVDVRKPESFGPARIHRGHVTERPIITDSDTDADAEIGGVVYNDGAISVIGHQDFPT